MPTAKLASGANVAADHLCLASPPHRLRVCKRFETILLARFYGTWKSSFSRAGYQHHRYHRSYGRRLEPPSIHTTSLAGRGIGKDSCLPDGQCTRTWVGWSSLGSNNRIRASAYDR